MQHLRLIALILILLAPAHALAHQPESALGDWHGQLATPVGDLTLVISIEQDDEGNLAANLESPDQAPGHKFPASEIELDGDELRFTISAIGARYTGKWDADAGHWDGTFTQGMDIPLILKPGLPEAKAVYKGMDGRWTATLDRNGVPLRLVLRITTTDDRGTTAVLDSPDTMAAGIPVTDFTKDGQAVTFAVAPANATFQGTLTDESTLTGTWNAQGDPEARITFTHSDEVQAAPNRPQHPQPPYDYRVEEVTIENPAAEGVTLAGTLTIPNGEGPFPAAILISGSGPQDRDETLFGHKPFLVLADHLTKNGIAVLRYDDRGVADSTGDHATATSADFATDANAALDFLTNHSDINADAIGFIGHSEGGMIAPIAIADQQADPHSSAKAAYMVLLAAPGTDTPRLLSAQSRLIARSQGETDESINRRQPAMDKLMATVAQSETRDEAHKQLESLLTPELLEQIGATGTQRQTLIDRFTSPWIFYFLRYDPAEYLPQITIPVLALNGSNDLQVPADENLARIRQLMADNPDVTAIELDNLNHLFQQSEKGTMAEYGEIEQTFDPEAMEIIAEWISERFANSNEYESE